MTTKNKVKIFISYCHADKNHKDEILKFLYPNEDVDIWYDKELLAGDEFDDAISIKIEESDVFIFLITQDFITSKYCNEIELNKALLRKADDEELRIIPVILDYCTFEKSALCKYNAMPEHAKPVTSYSNMKKAYLEIAHGIEEIVSYIKEKKHKLEHVDVPQEQGKFTLNTQFKIYLSDLGFTIQHRKKEVLFLEDLFIYPDLKRTKYDFDDYDVFVSSKSALNNTSVLNKKILIIGSEQSGKSTLAKTIFKDYYNDGFMPVIVKGEQFRKTSEVDSVIDAAINEQYLKYDYIVKKEMILIVDDIYESPMNEKFQRVLIEKLIQDYGTIIIIADSKLRFNEQLFRDFDSFTHYELIEFSHIQKAELVEKWNMIGLDETSFIEDFQSNIDNMKRNIDSILMKNIVPSKPVFILMILQILESNTQSNFSLTSYGHCYHSLIVQSFNKANVKADSLNDYFNYLSELAYFIYTKGNHSINVEQFSKFKDYYSENYYLASHNEFEDKLKKSKIIQFWNEKYRFQYKYIYYFFVAKKVTEISLDKALTIIDELCSKIHTEKCANILIFITHHTRDSNIIDRISETLSSIFASHKVATLGKSDVEFLNLMACEIPQIVMDKSKDVESERKKYLIEKDKVERFKNSNVNDYLYSEDEEEEDIDAVNKDLLDVNRSYKAVEVLGQIIRNRKGSIPIPQLEKLGMQTYAIGFRFLDFYYSITRELKEEIIAEVHRLISEKKSWNTDKIAKEASLFYWTYSYIMSLNVIKKIAHSVGHKDLTTYYSRISKQFGSEISKLVEITIQLEFTKKINRQDIEEIWTKVKDNLMTRRLLQEILITHLHMHYTKHEDKAWIAEKLSISVKDQLALQNRTSSKVPQIKIKKD
ncbi:TIR domain-containing protein [Pantoea ananatis]|uniref:TIR domain-containing protein n=1 Tax=Pantoea ananas TaxID=553 RepID=UPI001B30D264|nr:TIR domain-containing protein [Pantoea ananatis]